MSSAFFGFVSMRTACETQFPPTGDPSVSHRIKATDASVYDVFKRWLVRGRTLLIAAARGLHAVPFVVHAQVASNRTISSEITSGQ